MSEALGPLIVEIQDSTHLKQRICRDVFDGVEQHTLLQNGDLTEVLSTYTHCV